MMAQAYRKTVAPSRWLNLERRKAHMSQREGWLLTRIVHASTEHPEIQF